MPSRWHPPSRLFFNAKPHQVRAVRPNGAGRSLPVTKIIPDARTNALLVAGSRESFAAIEAMIKKLDGDQTLPLNEFRVFLLKNASATMLQPTIQQLFDQRAQRDDSQSPKRRVTVVSDPRTNGLIVGANPEELELADALIKRLDVEPETPGMKAAVFPLQRADALSVANTLRSIYAVQLTNPGTPGQPAGVAPPPNSLQANPVGINRC